MSDRLRILLSILFGVLLTSASAWSAESPAAKPQVSPSIAAAASAPPAGSSAYARVMAALSATEQRLPGSAGYQAGIDAVAKVLHDAHLTVHRQTYTTLVPHTQICRLIADGVEIADVHPLGPNGIALPTTWGHALSGPLLFLGDGSMSAMDGKPVRGCVAIVDLGSPNLGLVFSQGARAVVLVGDDAVSQWQAEACFTSLPAAMPVAWIDRAHAKAAGLLDAAGAKTGSLELSSIWKPVQATNLWTKIPPTDPIALGDDEQAQAIVLSAELDTFGAVPERSPQLRAAANAALLAQVATQLATGTLRRPVYIVFFGSHYAAQDGARTFYFPIGKVMTKATGAASMEARENDLCQANLAKIERQQAMLTDLSFISSSDNEAVEISNLAAQHLAAQVDELNYELLQQFRARNRIASVSPEQAQKEGLPSISELDTSSALIKSQKDLLNELRKELSKKEIKDVTGFGQATSYLAEQLAAYHDYFKSALLDTRSAREIELAMINSQGESEGIAAHFTFDFASATAPWMFCPFGSNAWAYKGDVALTTFSKQLKVYKRVGDALHPVPGQAQLWIPDESIGFRTDALSTPHQRSVSCTVPMAYGIPAFQLMTIGDPLAQDEMPVRGEWKLEALAPLMTSFMRGLLALENIPAHCDLTSDARDEKLVIQASGAAISGTQAVDDARGSDLIKGPAENAVIAVGMFPNALVGPEPRYSLSGPNIAFAQIDATGHCFLPGIIELPANGTEGQTQVFGFDGDGGLQRFSTYGSGGATRADLHFGTGGLFFTPFRPQDYSLGTVSSPLLTRTDSTPKLSFASGYEQAQVFYYPDVSEKVKMLGDGIDMLGLQADPRQSGIATDPASLLALDVNAQAGRDLIALNLGRLKVLRERNIINKPLERLQADGQDELVHARDTAAKGQVRQAAAHNLIANVLGDRVHQPLRDNIDDLVKAVVILLVLSLPFSFAMERLLFGARTIYRQVTGFSGIFITTFVILYFTHPAFSLAEAPIIIFLAFVILLLSIFVINVVLSKFKYELRAMQGLSSKAHGGGQENGTALAAIAIGISGMRNRPLKTALTATTVALLTFTILVFASFSSSLGVVPTYLGPAQGMHRIEYHSQSFLGLPSRLVDSLSTLYGDRYQVFTRGASFRDPTMGAFKDDVVNVALNPRTLEMQSLDGILVLDPQEITFHNAIDPMFSPLSIPLTMANPKAAPPVMLSGLVADKLKVKVGDDLEIRGQHFTLVGIFDSAKLKSLENIDGTHLNPPDFDATFKASGEHAADSGGAMQTTFKQLDVNNFIFSSPDLIAIATPQGMGNLGMLTNFVTFYPKEGASVDDDAAKLAEYLQGPVSACSDAGSTRFFFTEKFEGSGVLEVLVPLLLGGLIIFSSLLGSIVDRQKEIFTYSALGLAPPDVATLFFAESAVFAVIGGMGGYLISQIVVKLLSVLAEFGIARVPDVNFSSFSSIVTILIVMVTVMLSTIYPALMASKSANPGVARKWRMPKPDGDTMRFTFPFTVSAESIAGILAFIREHFDNHGDASLGAFAAREVAITSTARADGSREMSISAEIALAPFDLGVFQRFSMTTKTSDIAGIDEVVVELVRLNGSTGTWVRGNRAFIDDLREQFLRWRSLPVDSVEQYHRLAESGAGVAHG